MLLRIRGNDQEAWRRFVHLYTPLVYEWCRRFGLQEADTADVGQDVFRTVAASIDRFHHDRKGDSFRGWLRSVTRSRAVDLLRRKAHTAVAAGGSDANDRLREVPEPVDDTAWTDEADELILVRRSAELVLSRCKEETRQAFVRVVLGGENPRDVARDLGVSANAVYLAKSHTLRKIRDEFEGFVDL